MVGQTILILPFGFLPVFLLIAYVVWKFGEGSWQGIVGNKRRQGITEYPTAVSLLLYGTNENKIEFSDDGTSVIVTVELQYAGITDRASAKEYLKRTLEREDDIWPELVDCHVVEDVVHDEASGCYRLKITLPDDVVRTEKYIEHEIRNVGRVFIRNTVNHVRWLLFPQGERTVVNKDGRIYVQVERRQLVPGIFDWKDLVMSERQITRNIKNRLWNRLDVRCISIDNKTYYGEIILS